MILGIVNAHLESAPANVVDAWSEFDNGGDLQKTKDEAERVNQQFWSDDVVAIKYYSRYLEVNSIALLKSQQTFQQSF